MGVTYEEREYEREEERTAALSNIEYELERIADTLEAILQELQGRRRAEKDGDGG